MRLNGFLATVLIAGAVFPLAMAGAIDDKVRGDFFAGFAGDPAALKRAMEASAGDDSAEALAWHGGGLLVMAGRQLQQGDLGGGGELWAKAVAEMDKAGALAPDDPTVLIPRAAVWMAASRQAPPRMGRPLLAKGIADYEHVYDLQKIYFETLSVHMRSELLFGLADGHARNGDPEKARAYFEKLAAIGPESGHLEQATQFLNGEKYVVKGAGCAGCHTAK